MYRPGNKWQPTTVWGIDEVLEKFEIQKVDQVIDFLGMMGDTADNIPGIRGVGEKTAQKFIAEFGSMEGLFENTHKLKGKMKEKVEEAKEIGLQSKQLVTIITDVPINFYEKDLRVEKKDEDAIKKLSEFTENITTYPSTPEIRIDCKDDEEKNKVVNQLPGVYHYSWFDIKRKIYTYKDYWSKHWTSMYNKTIKDSLNLPYRAPHIKVDKLMGTCIKKLTMEE